VEYEVCRGYALCTYKQLVSHNDLSADTKALSLCCRRILNRQKRTGLVSSTGNLLAQL
jgi:hypothetical protein